LFKRTNQIIDKEGIMEAIIGGVVGLAVGAVATKMSPDLASGAGTMVRGVAREVIKGGLIIQEAVSGMFSGGGNYFSDLVAEARAELNTTGTLPAKAHSHK
jgi:hypothetical protein